MLVARSCDCNVIPLNIYASLSLTAAHARLAYIKSDVAHFCLLFSFSLSFSIALLLCTLLYHYRTILQCCFIIRLMADTLRELDGVNCILLPDDVLARGPRTPVAYSEMTGAGRRHPPN